MVKRFPGQEICCMAGRVSKERGTACCAPLSACQKSPPARSSCGRSRRNQIKFVISGGMYVGNDTAHEIYGDNFYENRAINFVQPFSKKWLPTFSKVSERGTACCAPLCLLFVIWSWEKEQVPENRPLCGGMKGAGGGFRRSTPLPFCRILFILHKTAAKNLTMQMLT